MDIRTHTWHHPDEPDETAVIYLEPQDDGEVLKYHDTPPSEGQELPDETSPNYLTVRLTKDDAQVLGARLQATFGKPYEKVTRDTVAGVPLPLAFSAVDTNVVSEADIRLHADRADWPTGLELEMSRDDVIRLVGVLNQALADMSPSDTYPVAGELMEAEPDPTVEALLALLTETVTAQGKSLDLLERTLEVVMPPQRFVTGVEPVVLDEGAETVGPGVPCAHTGCRDMVTGPDDQGRYWHAGLTAHEDGIPDHDPAPAF